MAGYRKYATLAGRYSFHLAPNKKNVTVTDSGKVEELLADLADAPDPEGALLAFNVGLALQGNPGTAEYAKPLYLLAYETQLRLQEQTGTRFHKGSILHNLGILYGQLGQPASGFRAILLAYLDDYLASGKDGASKGWAFRVLRTRCEMRPAHFDQLSAAVDDVLQSDATKDARVSLAKLFPEALLVLTWEKCKYVAPTATEPVENVNWVLIEHLIGQLEHGTGDDWRIAELWLATYLLGAHCFEVRNNIWTRTREYEFDVLVSSALNQFHLASTLGSYLAGEAKNWDKPAGVPAVDHFASKLVFHEMTFGVLLSKAGLSGDKSAGYSVARKTLLKMAHRHGLFIAVWSMKDLKRIAAERIGPVAALRLAYENERFELPAAT